MRARWKSCYHWRVGGRHVLKGNVVMALWKPGAEVVLDFVSLASGAFQTQDLSNLKLTHVKGHVVGSGSWDIAQTR